MLFKYLFGGMPVLNLNDGTYVHRDTLLLTEKQDILMHSDAARHAEFIPVAGGFCRNITNDNMELFGESVSCRVSTHGRAIENIMKHWQNDVVVYKKEVQYGVIYVVIESHYEPSMPRWFKCPKEELIKLSANQPI